MTWRHGFRHHLYLRSVDPGEMICDMIEKAKAQPLPIYIHTYREITDSVTVAL